MERPTYPLIILNDFPVAIHWVFSLSASIVDDTFPHLKAENGKGHDEEGIKDKNVAKLTHGQKKSIDEHLHTWNSWQTS